MTQLRIVLYHSS